MSKVAWFRASKDIPPTTLEIEDEPTQPHHGLAHPPRRPSEDDLHPDLREPVPPKPLTMPQTVAAISGLNAAIASIDSNILRLTREREEKDSARIEHRAALAGMVKDLGLTADDLK